MSPQAPGALVREGLLVLLSVGGPVLGVLLLVGLVVGILQAATQLNDPAVGFMPRAIAAVAVVWLAGPWILERLAGFLASAILRMAGG